jgi:hypothetical protein
VARLTYLELVVDILNDLDSDTVSTILETEESRQVTQILETTYYNIIDGKDWPHLYNPFQLVATGASTPTHMTFPVSVIDVSYIKYNVRNATDTKDKFIELGYREPKAFMDVVDTRDSSATEITQVTDGTGILINVYNDRKPSFWTSFDDDTVVFDAYDSVVDTANLVAVKTQAYGKIYPVVVVSDGAFFDLPVNSFTYLLNEAKSVASLTLKQFVNQKAEQQSVTQRRRMSQEAWRIGKGIDYPNYGRTSKK